MLKKGDLVETNEITMEEEIANKVEEKLKLRDKSLAYKNNQLERENKILKKRFDNILRQYETLNKKLRTSSSNINFKLMI